MRKNYKKPKNYDVKLEREKNSLVNIRHKRKDKINSILLSNKTKLNTWIYKFIRKHHPTGQPSILDVGCFDGFTMRILKENGYTNLFGIEIDKELRRMSEDYGHVYSFNLEKPLPLRDKCFDVIIENNVHEHLYNSEQLIKETYRILRDNGILIIYTSNHQHISKRLLFLFGYIGYRAFGFGEHHVRFVSHKILMKWLKPYFHVKHLPFWFPFANLFKRTCWYVCTKKRVDND